VDPHARERAIGLGTHPNVVTFPVPREQRPGNPGLLLGKNGQTTHPGSGKHRVTGQVERERKGKLESPVRAPANTE
jgi:hypothetical protein